VEREGKAALYSDTIQDELGREGWTDNKYIENLEGKEGTCPTHISTIQWYDPTRSVDNRTREVGAQHSGKDTRWVTVSNQAVQRRITAEPDVHR